MDLSAAERARWLAELAEALEHAQRLVWNLGSVGAPSPELMELYGRLDAVQAEVQMMRFKREALPNHDLDTLWPGIPSRRSNPAPD
jgi:hypothetical protein